jgi:hypothetical protein
MVRDTHSIIIEEPGHPPLIRLTDHLLVVCYLFTSSYLALILFKNGEKQN